jgi:uncharacterized protein YjbI with pentapeptide repeats
VNRNDRALLKATMEALEQLTLESRALTEAQARQHATPTRSPEATTTGWAKAGVLIQAIGIVAIIISIIGLLVSTRQFDKQQATSTRQFEEQQATTEEGLNLQDQTVLSGYIDDMSTLMLQDNLLKSNPGAPVRATAIARTAIAVQNADPALKGTLIRYLWEAGLITGPQPIINLYQFNLDGAIFANANLYQVALSQVRLTNANFAEASLMGAYLQRSVLFQANLARADLACYRQNVCTNLSGAYVIGANLSGADLGGASLVGADLAGANLTGSHIIGANLQGATYNAKPIFAFNQQGELVTEMPTRWPRGFDFKAAGATCDDC